MFVGIFGHGICLYKLILFPLDGWKLLDMIIMRSGILNLRAKRVRWRDLIECSSMNKSRMHSNGRKAYGYGDSTILKIQLCISITSYM